jgi:trehalose-phosphatase
MSERVGPRTAPAAGRGALDAVLFDLDGVVTDTARAHAAAWQRLFDEYLKERARRGGEAFRPFDSHRDYRRYVDGKPRSGGVKSFLESRGIELRHGDEDDGPDQETVCGLGNRKDAYFQSWLEENEVEAYPGTLALIEALREAGVAVGLFSASRNASAVLASAGALHLFDAKVDGADLAELGLPGKPAPAMLLEAACRLGVTPARTAIVEDAIAGVEAGVRGGFGLVIGVARGAGRADLETAGAHLVVGDLAELRFVASQGLRVKTLANLPPVWEHEEAIRSRLAESAPAVFLDYDGTLTPIVEEHRQALLHDDMRAAVAELGEHCAVTIVSGRDLAKLRELVALGSIWYAGSHGLEIAGPEGDDEYLAKGSEFLPELDELEHALLDQLAGIEGHAVERKRFSMAVHYRQVAEDAVGALRSILDGVLCDYPRLRMGHGKKVFEIRPDIDWHKGRAVLWILQRLGLERTGVVPVCIGDDITDEDAFRVLAGRGLCIAVRHDEMRQTAADYTLKDTKDVRRFLELLCQIVASRAAGPGVRP